MTAPVTADEARVLLAAWGALDTTEARLARTVVSLADDVARLTAETGELRERDAFLTRERIAVATALDVPYATDLGEAVALRLARLTADLAASRQAHATLAAAQRAYVQHGEFACDDVRTEAREAVVALLSDAPAPSMVPAALVREYLAAEHDVEHDFSRCKSERYDSLREKRAALDAALERCV